MMLSSVPDRPATQSWYKPLALTLGLRIFYSSIAVVFSWVSSPHLELMRSNALTETLPLPNHSMHYLLLDTWNRFDTLWYLHIAQHGYDLPASTVFYPLYSLLIKMAGGHLLAALGVSTVASFFAFWGFQQLLALDFQAETVQRNLLIFALWPASFIYFAGYAESLLLALVLWSLYAARREWWSLASLLAFLACITKAAGILVLVPLIVIALRRRSIKASWILASPWGFAGFLLWLQHRGFDTPAHIYAQYWHTKISYPWSTLWTSFEIFVHSYNAILLLNLFFLLLFCWLIFISRTGLAYMLFGASAIFLFLTKQTSPPLQSMVRYLLIIFPTYIGIGRLFEDRAHRSRFIAFCVILLTANVGFLWLFLGWSLVV